MSIIPIIIIAVAALCILAIMKGKQSQATPETTIGKRFFSADLFFEKTEQLLKRFPVTILMLIGFAVLCFSMINVNDGSVPFRLWVFFSVGAFLSASAMLLAEDFLDNVKCWGITIVVVLLWGIYCAFLPESDKNMPIGKIIEIGVIALSSFFVMFFVSFFRRNSDRAFWNFTTQTVSQLVIACFFGGIIFGGLALALLAINGLFNAHIKEEVFANVAVVCFVLFAPIYFLANIADRNQKHISELTYNKLQKILGLYILTPILALYALILYAYLARIMMDWQLPRGWVSWLVSALALGGLLVTVLLFPLREAGKSKIATFLGRWFGVIILPLLILMTIGILRRIGDYGITINRCYILLLNIWFYSIYIYLFFTRSRGIKWILITPIAIALLASVNVWGVAKITENSLNKTISHYLQNSQISINEARTMISSMSPKDKEQFGGALEYMYETFGRESVQVWFTDSVSVRRWDFVSQLGLHDVPESDEDRGSSFSISSTSFIVGQVFCIDAFNSFVFIDYRERASQNNFSEDNLTISDGTMELQINDQPYVIPLRELILENRNRIENTDNKNENTIIQGDDYMLIIERMNGRYFLSRDSIHVSRLNGYLFFNQDSTK